MYLHMLFICIDTYLCIYIYRHLCDIDIDICVRYVYFAFGGWVETGNQQSYWGYNHDLGQ